MSNRIKYGVAAGIAAIIIVIFGIIYFIFGSKADSPEYSVQMIEDAIVNHDQTKFNNAVDVDSLLNTSYDSFVEGMIDSDKSMPSEVKDHVINFTQMLKVPMTASLKAAIENYVATGNFEEKNSNDKAQESQDDNVLAISEILDRTGLSKLEFRQVDGIKTNDDNENQAIAGIRVYQQEAARDFTFDVLLEKNDSNVWRVVSINNFRDFIEMVNQARREQLDKYLDETASIINRHDKTIREAEQKYGSILSIGSLGQDGTRDDLKTLMTDVVKKDWEVRKQELFNVKVPKGAEALQNLRIKICDLSIESADLYAKWMNDKKAATIKDADEKRRQVQTLLGEEKILVSRMMK